MEFDDPELTGFSLGEIDGILSDASEKSSPEPGPEDFLPADKPSYLATNDCGLYGQVYYE